MMHTRERWWQKGSYLLFFSITGGDSENVLEWVGVRQVREEGVIAKVFLTLLNEEADKSLFTIAHQIDGGFSFLTSESGSTFIVRYLSKEQILKALQTAWFHNIMQLLTDFIQKWQTLFNPLSALISMTKHQGKKISDIFNLTDISILHFLFQ